MAGKFVDYFDSNGQRVKPTSVASASAKIQNVKSHVQRAADLASMSAGERMPVGRFLVNSPGEAYVDITFGGVSFTDAPIITFGYEIQSITDIIRGQAPMMTSEVFDWYVDDTRAPITRLYQGARILVVSEGPPNTKFIVHWATAGIAFSSPIT